MPYQVSMMGWVGSDEDFCGLGWVGLGWVQKFWVGLGFEKVTHDQLCVRLTAMWFLKQCAIHYSAYGATCMQNMLCGLSCAMSHRGTVTLVTASLNAN